jgi:hypothetical protein
MTRQRRRANASRNAGFSATVSDRALIIFAPSPGSFAQCGTRPHRSSSPRGSPSLEVVTQATSSVGATLKRWRSSTASPSAGNRVRTRISLHSPGLGPASV